MNLVWNSDNIVLSLRLTFLLLLSAVFRSYLVLLTLV